MFILEWSQQFSVGIDIIDREHKVLFELYNELHYSILRGETHAFTAEKLSRLLQYTREHFGEEERLMAECGYPKLEDHCASHRVLTGQVEEMMAELERNQMVVNLPTIQFLNEWITLHILREDRAYIPWMRQLGEMQAKDSSLAGGD
jgi:hemerythrin